MTTTPKSEPITARGDLPLPGMYECITMQCNVTLYRAGGTLRSVTIVRDPNAQTEIERKVIAATAFGADSTRLLTAQLRDALATMAYLMFGDSDTVRSLLAAAQAQEAGHPAGAAKRAPRKRA